MLRAGGGGKGLFECLAVLAERQLTGGEALIDRGENLAAVILRHMDFRGWDSHVLTSRAESNGQR